MRCNLPNFESKRLGKIFRSRCSPACWPPSGGTQAVSHQHFAGSSTAVGVEKHQCGQHLRTLALCTIPHGQPCTSLAALGTALVAPHPLPLLWLRSDCLLCLSLHPSQTICAWHRFFSSKQEWQFKLHTLQQHVELGKV